MESGIDALHYVIDFVSAVAFCFILLLYIIFYTPGSKDPRGYYYYYYFFNTPGSIDPRG